MNHPGPRSHCAALSKSKITLEVTSSVAKKKKSKNPEAFFFSFYAPGLSFFFILKFWSERELSESHAVFFFFQLFFFFLNQQGSRSLFYDYLPFQRLPG